MNFYDILQVSKEATDEEIKRAYQDLARKHHPDKSTGSESNEEFLKIDKAYKVLRDKLSRRIYDSELFQNSTAHHLIIHDTVSRNQFSFDEDEKIYYFQCKCGSFYTLDNINTKEDVILSCDECSLNIMVKN